MSQTLRKAALAITAAWAVAALALPCAAFAEGEEPTVTEDNTKRYTWSQTKECYEEDLDGVRSSFASSIRIDDGDYHGNIPLVSVTEVPVTEPVQYETNQVRVVSGLPDNDVSRIEQSAWFTVDSGNEVQLELAGISWEVEAYDEHGLPSSFSAYCNYRGVDTVDILDHYEVTAYYDGPIDAPVEQVSVETKEVVDERQEIVAVDAGQGQEGGGQEQDGPGVPWPLVAGLGAAGAAAGGLAARRFILFWWWTNRFMVTEERDGRERTLARCRVEVIDDVACAEVPSFVPLSGDNAVRGYMPKKHVEAGRSCRILFEGAGVIYSGPSVEVLELNQRGWVK